MPRTFVDLSVPLEADIPSDPELMLPQIEYFDHKDTAEQMAGFFPGMTPDQLPGGDGWALEKLTIYTHNGTHLDAPYHHHSTMNGGERAITIDEVPLEWCFAPGVKLDFRHLPDGHVVSTIRAGLGRDRGLATRNRSTASRSSSNPIPGIEGTFANPSTTLIGSSSRSWV